MKIEFGTIYEGDCAITFKDPLVVEIYSENEEDAMIVFDFGLEISLNTRPNFKLKGHNGNLQERVRGILEFELFHTFFHYKQDPNYNTFNWALFGNLNHRVILIEASGQEKRYVDMWTYENGNRIDIN